MALNTKEILNNLYGLMMEINFHRSDEDILAQLQTNPDQQIDKHLLKIKQLSSKLRAEANKIRFQKAIEQITLLKQKGLDELKKFLKPQEQFQLVSLFSKFEELTSGDEAAILEDEELLNFMATLKDRLDEDTIP
ncbi:MAG: hypothetical protein KF741_13215 [Ferruginibacter sp.]|nr:hypothetical protein [Bacteroidota bacterium]MBX2920197.1 hypothetical protein [Ferruginibacter sp.]